MSPVSSKGWKPGQSGNPRGRPPGSGQVAKLREQIAESIPSIIQRLVEKALDGDPSAARLLIERIIPPLRSVEPVSPITLPDSNLSDQGKAVLAAAGAGQLTTAQASQLLTALGALAKLVETDALDRRIAALEAKQESRR